MCLTGEASPFIDINSKEICFGRMIRFHFVTYNNQFYIQVCARDRELLKSLHLYPHPSQRQNHILFPEKFPVSDGNSVRWHHQMVLLQDYTYFTEIRLHFMRRRWRQNFTNKKSVDCYTLNGERNW